MEGFEIKDYSAIISGGIAAISTLCAVIITNYYHYKTSQQNLDTANKQRISQLKLDKLEEFYLLFEKWQTNLGNICLYHLRAYTGQLSFNQVLDGIKDFDILIPGEAQKLKMLLNIHFPELIEDYKKVDKARELLVPYLMSDPEKNNLKTNDFRAEQAAFERVCTVFKEKVSSHAENIL